MISENDTQCIRSFHSMHDLCNGLKRITCIIIIQQMSDHFRICIRDKLISFCLQLLFQLQIILNNPIMNHHNTLIFIKMRMCIGVRRFPMRSPPSMSDSKCSRHHAAAMSHLTQNLQSPLGLHHFNFCSIIYSNTGRVISSVLQF